MANLKLSVATCTIGAQCHCKAISYTLTLPTAILPIPTHMCHCSRCRYTHGTMVIMHTPIPAGIHPQFEPISETTSSASHILSQSPAASLTPATVTRYFFPGALGDRRFCATCGAHMGDYVASTDSWYVATALFPADTVGTVFLIDEHIYSRSAPKGMWEWMPRIGDKELKLTQAEDGSDAPEKIRDWGTHEDEVDRLRAECHCGGVSFSIRRPNLELLSNSDLWSCVSPADGRKWMAVVDVSAESRLSSGVPVNAWAFVPASHIGSPSRIGRDLQLRGTRTYASSPGKLRSFCTVCGANVFFLSPSRQPPGGISRELSATGEEEVVIGVAVGILRSPGGVRADDWLAWQAAEDYGADAGPARQDGWGGDYCESLDAGFRQWGRREDKNRLLDFEIGTARGEV